MSDSGALSPQLVKRRSSTPGSTPGRSLDVDESFLFETPTDLVCPITQAPFVDPALTASGHVYEKAAIEQYLHDNNVDPLSRQPLVNKSLTPVFVLKSRATEYRENAAKACVERACSRSCPDPVRYLRRAVELVADAQGMRVRGLSQEAVDYVVSHPSNAYDRLALQTFAQGLFQAGYRDRAAAVYYHLLVSGSDRAQQAQLLRRCLACWSQGGTLGALRFDQGPSSSSSGGGAGSSGQGTAAGPGVEPGGVAAAGAAAVGAAAGSQPAAAAATAVAVADPHVFEKLVLLFDGQASLGWGQIIDMAGEAGLGEEFVVRLCEQLLFRPMPREASAASPGGGELAARPGGPPGWDQEKEVLLKYVKVLTQGVKDRTSETARRLWELEQWQQGGAGGGASGTSGGSSMSGGRLGGVWRRGGPRGGRSAGVCRPAWLAHPLVVGGLLLVAVLTDPTSVPGRMAGAVPILALLPAPQ